MYFPPTLKPGYGPGPVASTWSVHFSLYLYVIMQLCLEKGKYLCAGLLTCVLLLWHTRRKKTIHNDVRSVSCVFLLNHWSQNKMDTEIRLEFIVGIVAKL